MIKSRVLAFSLIELIVAIGIIGVLSAVAVPSYKSYLIKSKVVDAVSLINAMQKEAIFKFEREGSFPNPLSIGGKTIAKGGWLLFTSNDVMQLHYQFDASYVKSCARLREIGIPGQGTGGQNSWVCAIAHLEGNLLKSSCGIGYFAGYTIPVDYLPSGCQCTNIHNAADPGCP